MENSPFIWLIHEGWDGDAIGCNKWWNLMVLPTKHKGNDQDLMGMGEFHLAACICWIRIALVASDSGIQSQAK